MKKILCVFVAVMLMMQMFAMFGTVSALNEPVIKVASVSGTAGSKVTVALSVENNTGFGGIEAQVKFDKNVLEFVSAHNALTNVRDVVIAGQPDQITCESEVSPANVANTNGVVVYSYADIVNITEDVVLVELTFRIKEGAPAGDSVLTLVLNEGSYVLNGYEFKDLAFTCVNGKITVTEGLRGDVNKDGAVNSDDLTALARHVGGIEEITDAVGLANGDTNGDTLVNSDDLTRLARHVGGIEPFPEVG